MGTLVDTLILNPGEDSRLDGDEDIQEVWEKILREI